MPSRSPRSVEASVVHEGRGRLARRGRRRAPRAPRRRDRRRRGRRGTRWRPSAVERRRLQHRAVVGLEHAGEVDGASLDVQDAAGHVEHRPLSPTEVICTSGLPAGCVATWPPVSASAASTRATPGGRRVGEEAPGASTEVTDPAPKVSTGLGVAVEVGELGDGHRPDVPAAAITTREPASASEVSGGTATVRHGRGRRVDDPTVRARGRARAPEPCCTTSAVPPPRRRPN